MIGWPMYAEQRMNATMLSNEVGVAVKMQVVGDKGETLVVPREEIKRVVQMVMEGEEGKKMRSRAKELEASKDDESVKKTASMPKEEHDTVLSMPTGIVEEAKEIFAKHLHQWIFFNDNQAPRKDLAVLELSFKD
uniref:UDP-glucuronosyl/UDP-glucosyltransferase n=1 Tax=Tanacetum cinerariifolium TaxID=118510 RepID=A0A6L2JAY6_TANCI|nr:UDP-glucuronosyl/UDP-glucosyltransferase [Tanacetum cinerariifolium]